MGKTQIAEVKIKVESLSTFRETLSAKKAKSIGTDRQIDTYFKVNKGRLKLRQGEIESTLIFYDRPNSTGHKLSDVSYYKVDQNSNSLLEVLKAVHEIDVVVDKTREIYWIDNTKFHLDTVEGLGHFIEIEVMDMGGKYSLKSIHALLDQHLLSWGLHADDGIPESYSDLIRKR